LAAAPKLEIGVNYFKKLDKLLTSYRGIGHVNLTVKGIAYTAVSYKRLMTKK
jgi:hypothetical protein